MIQPLDPPTPKLDRQTLSGAYVDRPTGIYLDVLMKGNLDLTSQASRTTGITALGEEAGIRDTPTGPQTPTGDGVENRRLAAPVLPAQNHQARFPGKLDREIGETLEARGAQVADMHAASIRYGRVSIEERRNRPRERAP